MTLKYELTKEEAMDGLNGILPQKNKGAMRIAGMFTGITGALVLYMCVAGFSWRYFFFALACGIVAGWFFINRKLSVDMIGGRAVGAYLITISAEGWIRSGGKSDKEGEKIRFTADAFGAETPLTVSFRPDAKHMYVVPKSCLKGKKTEDLIRLLESVGCHISRI